MEACCMKEVVNSERGDFLCQPERVREMRLVCAHVCTRQHSRMRAAYRVIGFAP